MVSSAQKKVIVPKNGIISFKMQEIITDTLAYRASNKKMIKDIFLYKNRKKFNQICFTSVF